MKIYFTGAVSRVSASVRENYDVIVEALEEMGHVVIATHLKGKTAEDIKTQSEEEAVAVSSKMSKWKKQADLVVVEASTPSFGVGQEITEAVVDNKQVLVMYLPGKKPHVLRSAGADEPVYLVEYTNETLKSVLKDYLEYAKSRSDTRFNFFISPAIGSYLDWISRARKIPRAVYLRRLIEKDMGTNEDYNK